MEPQDSHKIVLKINGNLHPVEIDSNWTLNDVLRNRLDLIGTKRACDYGGCGSCTVLMDGVDVYFLFHLSGGGSRKTDYDHRGPRKQRKPSPFTEELRAFLRRSVRLVHAWNDSIGKGVARP